MLFHFEQIDSITDGDKNFKKELIEIFTSQIPEFVSNMKSYLDESRWTDLAREAHTAKSSVLLFGMEKTGTELKEIQLSAENKDKEAVMKLLPLVTKDLDTVLFALLKWLKEN